MSKEVEVKNVVFEDKPTVNFITKGIELITENSSRGKNLYKCLNCGTTKEIGKYDAYTKTNSCGNCINHILEQYDLDKSVYTTYITAFRRCYERSGKSYLTHGLRGINIDPIWKGNIYDNMSYTADGFSNYCQWLVEEGYKSTAGLTLERKDNNDSYSSNNCTLISISEQGKNKTVPTKRTKNTSSIYYGVCNSKTNWMATYWDGSKNINIQNKKDSTELGCALAYDNYIISNGLNKPLNKYIIENVKLIDKVYYYQDKLNTMINPIWKTQGYPWELYINVEAHEGIMSIPFKHWKYETPDFDNAKVEIVDIFFFIISNLISKGLNSEYFVTNFNYGFERSTYKMDESSLIKLFKNITYYSTLEDIETVIIILGMMTNTLGWTLQDLYDNYIVKHALNTHRQNNGYKNGTYVKMWKYNDKIVEDNVVAFEMVKDVPDLDKLVQSLQDYYINNNYEEIMKATLNKFRQDNGYAAGTYIKIWDGTEDNVICKDLWNRLSAENKNSQNLYSSLSAIYATLDM